MHEHSYSPIRDDFTHYDHWICFGCGHEDESRYGSQAERLEEAYREPPDLMAALERSLKEATCSSWRVHGTPICVRCTECGYGFPEDSPADIALAQAQFAYDNHVADSINTRGRHSRASCPLNTRAMCTHFIALDRAKAAVPPRTYEEQRQRAKQEAAMAERYSWAPDDDGVRQCVCAGDGYTSPCSCHPEDTP